MCRVQCLQRGLLPYRCLQWESKGRKGCGRSHCHITFFSRWGDCKGLQNRDPFSVCRPRLVAVLGGGRTEQCSFQINIPKIVSKFYMLTYLAYFSAYPKQAYHMPIYLSHLQLFFPPTPIPPGHLIPIHPAST